MNYCKIHIEIYLVIDKAARIRMSRSQGVDNQQYGESYDYLQPAINPLAEPLPWWYTYYKRIVLFPWWLRYNIGIARQANLKDEIIKLAITMGLPDRWVQRVLRHVVSEFSKKGLGSDYYGYHNIDHALEVTYFTLLAINGAGHSNQQMNNKISFSYDDMKYLFVAALFHDYDPLKKFDKPHEDAVEWYIRNDDKIRKFIYDIGININIVIALIHRTAYPFKGEIAEHATMRMQELFTVAGISKNDTVTREHYERLGWFLSVSDRIAGYALGDIEHGRELARRNAHALGWHPSIINEQSVKYFSSLKDEKEMVKQLLNSIPNVNKTNFFNNVQSFRDSWQEEIDIKASMRKGEITLLSLVEEFESKYDPQLMESIRKIHSELPTPVHINEEKFIESLSDNRTILITLRNKDKSGEIVGYVKGGPLENYKLRRGTNDNNFGRNNTAYMEWINIKHGYWGEKGGHMLRTHFLKEAKRRRYNFVTSYVHRDVILSRISKGENIEIIQKYDPDKLDYYRVDLTNIVTVDPNPLTNRK